MKIDEKNNLTKLSVEDIGKDVRDVFVTVKYVIYPRSEKGFTIFSCKGGFTCAGITSESPVVGVSYKISGKVSSYKEQLQVKLSSAQIVVDDGKEKAYIAAFLKDNFDGIGQKTSERIAELFGDKIIDSLMNNPHKIADKIPGLSYESMESVSEIVVESEDLYRNILSFRLLGLSNEQALSCIKNKGISVKDVKDNPYCLMRVNGISFMDCEVLSDEFKVDPLDKMRVYGALLHSVSCLHESYKSTWFNQQLVMGETWKVVKGRDGALAKESLFPSVFNEACEICKEQNTVAIYKFSNHKCESCSAEDKDARFSLISYFKAEAYIKREVEKFVNASVNKPSEAALDEVIDQLSESRDIVLDDVQRQALKNAMYQPISIITGGPGTGKTTILGILADHFRNNNISCCYAAPTGRAAKRLSECVDSEAYTIHRMLGVQGNLESETGFVFSHNKDYPVDARVIIVDEMSMVDTVLFRDLLDAVGKGTSLILVGDPDQLPSVGCGNVLGDLLTMESMPFVKLDYIYRQDNDSSIASNSYRVLKGEKLISNDIDFEIITAPNDEEAFKILCDKYREADYLSDIAILTPTKKENSLLGTFFINNMIQEIVHREDKKDDIVRRDENVFFMVGDKVIQTKNDYSVEYVNPTTSEFDSGVFNGEIGTVIGIDPITMDLKVEFDDGKLVTYNRKSVKNLDLAYAMTVHKSQGCEFDEVIIALGKMNPLLYKRKLLYTAITRGKSKVTIIDSNGTLDKFLKSKNEERRITSLVDFLAIIDYKKTNENT